MRDLIILIMLCMAVPTSAQRPEPGTSTAVWGRWVTAEQLLQAKRDGVSSIEVALNQCYRGVPNEEKVSRMQAMKAAIDSAGIQVWSVHLPFSRQLDISVLDDSLRAKNVNIIARMIRLSGDLYAPRRMVLHPSSEPIDENERELRIVNAVASIRALKAVADETGAILCIENLPRTCLGNTPEELIRIVDAVPVWGYVSTRTAALLVFAACNDDPEYPWQRPESVPSQAPVTMDALWATSPFAADMTARNAAFDKIQGYADTCSSATFSSFLSGEEWLANSLAKYEDVIACYDAALDRVLEGIRSGKPATGEVHLWMLYNMGYVIQTPSGCFGVDIFHRRAAELAPYLDFYCITHIHQDHKTQALIDAMLAAGKPVLSHFLEPEPGYAYTASKTKDYTIGKFALHTFITSHNNGSTNVPVTVFQITCGDDTGNFVVMHSGDSNFIAAQYDVTTDIDVYIPRYAPNELTENNVIGKVFTPKYVLLSHILELTHTDPDSSRWTLKQGLTRASLIDCPQSYMPFWGEKMVWKNGKLQ